ncbi:MAG: hypothetical protein ACLRZG_10815 [Streptococcus sp.]
MTAPVGRDKDGTGSDEYIKTATAKYTPTVTPITVTPTNKVSDGYSKCSSNPNTNI